MIICVIGTITSIEHQKITIEDRITKEEIVCIPSGDSVLDMKVGDQGVFVGESCQGVNTLKKVEVRKFLDPLYETDLYQASSVYNMVDVIDNPFTEAYLAFMEKRKKNELAQAAAQDSL